MFLPQEPFETIEAGPQEKLRSLKNGMTDFETLGFASTLSADPITYERRQLEYLRNLLNDNKIAMMFENEVVGLFVKEYYLRTMLMATDLFLREALNIEVFFPEFQNMQKVLREVFPFWIDNDYLYGLGKNKLNILKSINIDIPDVDNFKALLSDVAILGMPPAVSIVLPTYNRGEKLLGVLPKVLNQTYKNFEIVVVDDGSTDNTEEVVRMFQSPQIKYIKLEKNEGQSHARNVGIENASYNYIAFADSDDIWEEKKLEIQMEALLQDKGAGFCYCAYAYYDSNERKHIVPRRTISKVRKEGYIYPELLRRNIIGTPTLVVKKECIEQIGGFNEEINCLEDWEYVLRLAKKYECVFCDQELIEAYEAGDKVSARTIEEGKDAMKHFYESFEKDRSLFGMNEEVFL